MTSHDCLGCSADTRALDEYYIVRDEVWLQAVPTGEGMLCIGCLEERIERPLTSADFEAVPLNFSQHEPRSLRLLDRMTDGLHERGH